MVSPPGHGFLVVKSPVFCRTKEQHIQKKRALEGVSPHDVFVDVFSVGPKLVKRTSAIGRYGLGTKQG